MGDEGGDRMTADTLKRLAEEALAMSKKATPGKWGAFGMGLYAGGDGNVRDANHIADFFTTDGDGRLRTFDLSFCISARTSLPQLALAVLALLPFARHKPNCIGNDPALDPSPCNCGLQEALGGLQ